MPPVAPVLVVAKRLSPTELSKFKGQPFPNMVKFVVDVDRGLLAIGGELHVDAEDILLDRDSQQQALWGGNYYPGLGEGECIQYTSLINIRPAQENPSMLVQSPQIREKMRGIVFALVGRGEPWS
jgi:hypothetical protein